MLVIKDTMVLIHLAKLSILEICCDYFKRVLIPELVYKEILKGEEKSFPDVPITLNLIENKKIMIKSITDENLIKKANEFNIQRGEAEVVALYWQEKANLIVTDDDNVRKKQVVLNLSIVGTPALILTLYKKKVIDKNKISQCISELRKIGWFSSTVLDKMMMEVER